jgi:hypothetical protein
VGPAISARPRIVNDWVKVVGPVVVAVGAQQLADTVHEHLRRSSGIDGPVAMGSFCEA